MDDKEAIRRLRERTEHDVTLPSGQAATIRLPNQQECILAGGVPLPVLERMAKITPDSKNGKTPQMSTEDIEHILRFRREIARHTLVAMDGERIEPVTLEVIVALDPQDFDELVAIGNREKPLPTKASVPTS